MSTEIAVNGARVSSTNPVPVDATSLGATNAATATWYSSTASLIQLMKLAVAAFVGAGSHVYGYTNGVLTTDAWTLLGVTRTKTYTYTNGVLTGESDWV